MKSYSFHGYLVLCFMIGTENSPTYGPVATLSEVFSWLTVWYLIDLIALPLSLLMGITRPPYSYKFAEVAWKLRLL